MGVGTVAQRRASRVLFVFAARATACRAHARTHAVGRRAQDGLLALLAGNRIQSQRPRMLAAHLAQLERPVHGHPMRRRRGRRRLLMLLGAPVVDNTRQQLLASAGQLVDSFFCRMVLA